MITLAWWGLPLFFMGFFLCGALVFGALCCWADRHNRAHYARQWARVRALEREDHA